MKKDGANPAASRILAETGHPDVDSQVRLATRQYGADFDALPLALTLLFYRMVSVIDRAHAIEFVPVGINGSQFNVLTVLHRASGPMRLGDLATALSVRAANLTAVVDTLRARGLVVRKVNPADKRSAVVGITEAGQQLLNSFLPGHWRFLDTLYGGLDTAERLRLTDLLGRLLLAAESNPGSRSSGIADVVTEAARHAWSEDRPVAGPGYGRRGRRPATRYA